MIVSYVALRFLRNHKALFQNSTKNNASGTCCILFFFSFFELHRMKMEGHGTVQSSRKRAWGGGRGGGGGKD
jgi:hypothetical protein